MKRLALAAAFVLPALLALPVTATSVGQPAPEFSAPDLQGKPVKLSDFKGKYVVLEWVNPECPYVRRHYDTGNMPELQKELATKGVVWLGSTPRASRAASSRRPSRWRSGSPRRAVRRARR